MTTLNSKLNLENISWPVYDKASIEDSDCNIVIQINGKKRRLISLPINSNESFVIEKAQQESNVKKYLINNNIMIDNEQRSAHKESHFKFSHGWF